MNSLEYAVRLSLQSIGAHTRQTYRSVSRIACNGIKRPKLMHNLRTEKKEHYLLSINGPQAWLLFFVVNKLSLIDRLWSSTWARDKKRILFKVFFLFSLCSGLPFIGTAALCWLRQPRINRNRFKKVKFTSHWFRCSTVRRHRRQWTMWSKEGSTIFLT